MLNLVIGMSDTQTWLAEFVAAWQLLYSHRSPLQPIYL